VEYFTSLPAFPFAPAIAIWAEWLLGMDVAQVDVTKAVVKLCQTPILVMQGGSDTVTSVASGQWAYDADCGTKEFWLMILVRLNSTTRMRATCNEVFCSASTIVIRINQSIGGHHAHRKLFMWWCGV